MAYMADDFDDEYFADLLNEDLDQLERQAVQSTQVPTTATLSHIQHASALQRQLKPEALASQADSQPELYEGDDEVIDAAQVSYPQLPEAVSTASLNVRNRSTRSEHLIVRSTAQIAGDNLPDAVQAPVRYDIPYRPSSQSQDGAEPIARPNANTNANTNTNPNAQHNSTWQAAVHGASPMDDDSVDLRGLQRQVQELLQDRERLQQAVQDANKEAYSKSGEIAIVRANNERITREKEKKITELERQLKDASDQRDAELEQAKKQQEQLATESKFANHDRVVERARGRQQQQQQQQQHWADQDVIISGNRTRLAAARPAAVHPTTPKKSRQTASDSGARNGAGAGAGDGFEPMVQNFDPASPFSQESTPKRKRKRLPASPANPIFSQDGNVAIEHDLLFSDEENKGPNMRRGPLEDSFPHTNDCYGVLQSFLERRLDWGKQRTIEALADFAFPSDDSTPLSSLLYDAISKIDDRQAGDDFAAALCALVITMWQRCITEKYFAPVKYLIDYVANCLFEYPSIASVVMDDLVPLAQTTCDVNIIPRFKHLKRQAVGKTSSSSSDLLSAMSDDVSVADSLDTLLQLTASLDTLEISFYNRFWRLIRFDFISMLLRSTQDPADVALLASLLSCGAYVDSIGSLLDTSEAAGNPLQRPAPNQIDQAKSEDHILDRLSSMLIETPKPVGEDFEQFNDETVTEMRLAILRCLSTYVTRPQLAMKLVRHALVIGRLVLCMSEGYHSAMMSSPNAGGKAVKVHLEVVGEATRLVFHLVNAYKDEFDLTEKLLKIRGGPQRCLVVLSRLVFSEGVLFDVEIDEDIIDYAQALLEDFVSPEEGDMLMEMVGDEE